MAEEKGVWRTIRGTRIFIKDGEDFEETLAKRFEDKKEREIARNKEEADRLNAEKKPKATEATLRANAKALGLDFEEIGRKHIKEFERKRDLYNNTPSEQVDKRNELRDWLIRSQDTYHIYKKVLK